MIKQTLSNQAFAEKDTKRLERIKREPNLQWLARAFADFALEDVSQWSFIVLAGAKDVTAFRLRVAQSHLRRDMLPSYWSDCALLKIDAPPLDQSGVGASLFNLPLLQPATASYAPKRNGLVEIPLNKLQTQKDIPNLALLAIPVAQQQILAALNEYQNARVSYDAVENILPWLAFVWGAGNAGNPLMQGIGFPSAMMLNQIFGSQGFDLAPGVNQGLSSPEAFWSGVNHWQDFYNKTQTNGLLPKVRFVMDHLYDIDEN